MTGTGRKRGSAEFEDDNDLKPVPQNSTGTLSDHNDVDEREEEGSAQRWLTTLLDWNILVRRNRREVKRRIRLGITDSSRSVVWQVISGGYDLQVVNPGIYSLLLSNETPKELKVENIIVEDIHRTLPSHKLFQTKDGPGQRSLYNVLSAYSVYDTDVGYTQGMNFIASIPLLYMEEEEAFWVMAGLLKGGEKKRIRGVYLEGLPLLRQYLFQFEILLKEQLPELATHFEEQTLAPTLYASSWFVSAFSADLPLPLVVRIWDIFLYEGVKIIFRVGLALLKLFQDDLLELSFERAFRFLRQFPKEALGDLDANTLITTACSFKIKRRLQELELEYEAKNDKVPVTSRKFFKGFKSIHKYNILGHYSRLKK